MTYLGKYRGALPGLRGVIGRLDGKRMLLRGHWREVKPGDVAPVRFWTIPDGVVFDTWRDAADWLYAQLAGVDREAARRAATSEACAGGYSEAVAGTIYGIEVA